MAYALIILAVACRLLPHPPNATPVLAVALLSGAVLPRRTAWLVPLAALVASDAALGYGLSWMSLVCYTCFSASVFLGRWLCRGGWKNRIAASLAGSTLFFLVTNFAVWASWPGMYTHTVIGMGHCYLSALPFFRNAVIGDLLWMAAVFGAYELTMRVAEARSPVEMA